MASQAANETGNGSAAEETVYHCFVSHKWHVCVNCHSQKTLKYLRRFPTDRTSWGQL
jgi:hypothetical protein